LRNLPLATISGVVVMATGIAALVGMSSGAEPKMDFIPVSAQEQSLTTLPAAPTTGVAGIDEAVQRTLESYGMMKGLDPANQSDLDPAIVRVLAGFGVTLTVPITEVPNP
jgi:hypothetical protein